VAPLPQAQLVESRLINILHFQCLIASKAARMKLAAPGKHLVDFGLRRAHGAEAGLFAARASYVAGFDGTATLLAEAAYGIPTFGTMAHSYVQAHDDEAEAFERFARARSDRLTLLLDTYDTLAAARKVVALVPKLVASGITIRSVRLDSGDLLQLSKEVRHILDEAGLGHVSILASGGLDEDAMARLVQAGAPIDAFGVGTSLTTSSDVPALDCAYKLQEYAGRPRRKTSSGKATWPGRKQVWRQYGPDGTMAGDVVGLQDELRQGETLLIPVMRDGKRIHPAEDLNAIRQRTADQLDRLPDELRLLIAETIYPVEISAAIRSLAEDLDHRTGASEATHE
jgi:nicotinate phosphoribosyltransferase